MEFDNTTVEKSRSSVIEKTLAQPALREITPPTTQEKVDSPLAEQEPGGITPDNSIIPSVELAPPGALTIPMASKKIGIAQATLRKEIALYRDKRPEWFLLFIKKGQAREFLHPELISVIESKRSAIEFAKEGEKNRREIAIELGVGDQLVTNTAEPYRKKKPEWFLIRKNVSGTATEYFHIELVLLIIQEINSIEPIKEGEKTTKELALLLGISSHTINKYKDHYKKTKPEWIVTRRARKNQTVECFRPPLVELIVREVSAIENVKDGWLTKSALIRGVDRAASTVEKVIESYRDDHPDWYKLMRTPDGNIYEHLHPELIDEVLQQCSVDVQPAREGERTARSLSEELNFSRKTIIKSAENFRGSNPDWFVLRKDAINRPREHYSKELVNRIKEIFSERNKRKEVQLKESKLKNNLHEIIGEISKGQSLQAQEFRRLTELFGSEKSLDLLFQFHPEYRQLSVPYVKSVLGEYLGDFLVLQGEFELDTLESASEYLANPDLKSGLTMVIRRDVLRAYNRIKKDQPDTDDREIIYNYIKSLYESTRHLENDDITEVLNEVTAYYLSLFEDIHKPDNLVDEISEGRLFPDINQHINIMQLATQNKILIADEMGLGKSASAILAKECLGVRQALVVAPSNVVDVWRNYLSDYFKEGQAPRVLIIEDLNSLEGINHSDYDYVVISQERLNDEYVELLKAFDYDMLIVDESHKLKNLADGKRAEHLIELSKKINGSKEKYLALLSGTPVPNKIEDIAITLKLLYPEKFENIPNKVLIRQILQGDMLDLRSLLLPRMEMKELGESVAMPELTQETEAFNISREEQEIYDILLEEDELTASQKMQFLRQFILNPQLLDATPNIDATKPKKVGEKLRKTFEDKDKVVMFINGYIEDVMRGDKSIFEELDLPENITIRTIDGDVSKAERLEIQRELRESDRKILLVVSGQTADVGVDFSAGGEVYFYNEPWTEYEKKQQLSRVFRPGLKADLIARTFYAKNTIEEGIHEYIKEKYVAVEKLLRGIPISEIEREMLRSSEKKDPSLEVNPELAKYYFSSRDKLMKFFGYVKKRHVGEEQFRQFLTHYGETYAESYETVGTRSYQSNTNRLSGAVIDKLARESGQDPTSLKIVDIASGPEMLRRHIADEYADSIISIDINPHHFDSLNEKRKVGSFLNLPVESGSIDYANLALGLHYAGFVPSKRNYERVEVLQEMNRVLKEGGKGVISMIHSLDFKDSEEFYKAVAKLGFKVVKNYSGDAESNNSFTTKLVTLEKVAECPQDIKEVVESLGAEGLHAFKFVDKKAMLRDSRKVIKKFIFKAKNEIEILLSKVDQQIYEEEQQTTKQLEDLKERYGDVKTIPKDKILEAGGVRIFNGKRYVLFKRLEHAPGAVVVR